MRPVAELGIAALLRALVEAAIYRKLMPSIVKIVLLILLTLASLGACGAVFIYLIYLAMVHAGWAQEEALAVVSGGLLVLAFICAMLALRKLRALHAQLHPLAGVKQNLICAAHAFSEGIQTPSR